MKVEYAKLEDKSPVSPRLYFDEKLLSISIYHIHLFDLFSYTVYHALCSDDVTSGVKFLGCSCLFAKRITSWRRYVTKSDFSLLPNFHPHFPSCDAHRGGVTNGWWHHHCLGEDDVIVQFRSVDPILQGIVLLL